MLELVNNTIVLTLSKIYPKNSLILDVSKWISISLGDYDEKYLCIL